MSCKSKGFREGNQCCSRSNCKNKKALRHREQNAILHHLARQHEIDDDTSTSISKRSATML
eukprot:5685053-Amphidinium_carterae.1